MDYTNIIENGRLIYSTIPTDFKLIDWPLNSTELKVFYYTTIELSVIDKLVCELLIQTGGRLNKQELGLILGFDIASTEYQGQTFYTDEAEIDMYQRLLDPLVQWHLIVIESQDSEQKTNNQDIRNEESDIDDIDNPIEEKSKKKAIEFVRITKVGRFAIEMGMKLSFHCAQIVLYSNLYKIGDKLFDYQFPYSNELGVIAQVSDTKTDQINPDTIDLKYESEWKDRLSLQLDSSWKGIIYNIEPQDKTLPLSHTTIGFKLYNINNEYKLLAFKQDVLCPKTSELINSENNLRVLNYRIKKCFYYKLINDEEALFTYNEVIPFWDGLEEDEYKLLLKDQRIDWTDFELFDLIVSSEYCTTQTWDSMSSICPTKVIKMHLDEYVDNFNWEILSRRMDIDYILSKSSFPWSYATILKRDDITKEIAQQIFLLPSTKETELDWELVENFLTIEFVKENIDSLNIDFYHLTSWLSTDDISIIFESPNKSWDWNNATKRFSLQQIVNNLSKIGSYINNQYLLDLCFCNETNTTYTLTSKALKSYFSEIIKEEKLCNFSLKNKPNYVWNDQTIEFFESIGMLSWESKLYVKGFAQYAFVKWTPEFFGKYYQKLTIKEDQTYVSSMIQDYTLIDLYDDFVWDWSALSKNPYFANNEDFIVKYKDCIVPSVWVNIAESSLIEKYFDILHLEIALLDKKVAKEISSKVSTNFIKSHPNLDWERSTYTIAMCKDSEVSTLLINKFYSHWDWDILSDYVPKSIVLENLSYPWETDILSKSICSAIDAVNLISACKERIDWDTISECIQYKDFQIIASTYSDKWNWETINCRFVSFFSKELVSNKSLEELIDWENVSKNSKLDTLAEIMVEKPEKINWEIATQRLCSTITIEMLLDVRNLNNWDWDYLSNNINIEKLIEGLEHSQLPWNGHFITERLSSDFILANLVKHQDLWDWDIIWNSKFNYDFSINEIQKIAKSLNLLQDKNNVQWSEFTKIFSLDDILKLVEKYLPSDGFHWDYKYVYEKVEDISEYVSQPHAYIDWTVLSESEAANKYFHLDEEIFDIRILKNMAKKRLDNPLSSWDYKSLTRLENIQKGYQVFFNVHTEAWDWDYISAEGYCLMTNNNGEANLRKYKDYVNFSILSKREDIGFSNELIQSYIDEAWDWQALSANQNVNVNIGFAFEHKDKDWNWTEVSRNLSIKWDKQAIANKSREIFMYKPLVDSFDWDFFVSRTDITFNEKIVRAIHKQIIDLWSILTSNTNFIPSIDSLNIAIEDRVDLSILNWDTISSSKHIIQLKKDKEGYATPDLSFVRKFAEFLKWTVVTRNTFFDIYNDSIVNEFKQYVDWNYVSLELENDKLNLSYLCSFKKYLDWNVINKKINYCIITEDCLGELKDYLDWAKVSNLNFKFTEKLLSKFSNKWDWKVLLHNTSFINLRTEKIKQSFKSQLNIATFMDNFKYGSPKIYHFTHLFNVIEVLKNRKILSRNKAQELGLLKFDSAGYVVGRTAKAHPFARFYYRPFTPTQFYNECLGWDVDLLTKWKNPKSYYLKALKLGLPKCPMPVFLEFDLQEVLSKNPQNCYYSDGNMQTNLAKVFKIEESPCNLKMEGLYGNEFWEQSVRDNSQQEFLIKDEFDFSELESLKIYCYDKETAEMLKYYLGNDTIIENINIGKCFSYNNRSLSFVFDENEDNILITSDYNGEGEAYFLVKGDAEILNTDDVIGQTSEGVVIYPRVNVRNTYKQCEIYFIDKRARTKKWMIYSNNDHLPNSNGMGLHLEQEILDNIKSFVHEMSKLPIGVNKDLFHPHMLYSCHGIAHTTRVLFATYLIVNILHLSEEEKRACYVASIIHDLGKSHDSEGTEHGLKSMKLYEGKISRLLNDSMYEKRVLNAVRYHSIEDKNSPQQIVSDVIWKVLKDADALDRSRFHGRGCDKSYLRLPIYNDKLGCNVFDIMSSLPQWASSLEWNKPYEELINQILKYID